MTDKHRNIASKIQKLMTLAERGEGNEAEVAAATAQRLMREYAISMASLKETEILEQDPLMEVAFEVGTASWKIRLAWTMAEHCQVKALRSTRWTASHPITKEDMGKYKRRVFAWGYGHSSDLEVWEYLYEVALRQIESEARKYAKVLASRTPYVGRKGDLYPVHTHLATGGWLTKREAMNRFRYGAVQGLERKLSQQRQEAKAQAEAECAADVSPDQSEAGKLLLAVQALEGRTKRAASYMREKNPKTGTWNGGVGSSSAGLKAGQSIAINKGVAASAGCKMLGG